MTPPSLAPFTLRIPNPSRVLAPIFNPIISQRDSARNKLQLAQPLTYSPLIPFPLPKLSGVLFLLRPPCLMIKFAPTDAPSL